MNLPADRYRKVVFHPDGDSILTLTRSPNFVDDGRIGRISLWRINGASKPAAELQLRDVNDFTLSSDGELVGVATDLGLALNRLRDGAQLNLPKTERPAQSLAFAPDNDRLAVGTDDGTIDIWSISKARVLHSLRQGQRGAGPMAFSHDGRSLATGLGDTIRIWDATTAQNAVKVTHPTHRNQEIVGASGQRTFVGGLSDYVPTVHAQLSANASYVAATGAVVIVYNTASVREIFCSSFEVDRGGTLMTPDGELLAVFTRFGLYLGDPHAGLAGSPVRLLALPSGDQSHALTFDGDWIDHLAFGARGRKLGILAINRDGSRRLSVRHIEQSEPPCYWRLGKSSKTTRL
jgi:WD40 repeat protein